MRNSDVLAIGEPGHLTVAVDMADQHPTLTIAFSPAIHPERADSVTLAVGDASTRSATTQ